MTLCCSVVRFWRFEGPSVLIFGVKRSKKSTTRLTIPVLLRRWKTLKFLLKILKVKIQGSPFGRSRVVVYGKAGRQTDRQIEKLIVRFYNCFAKKPQSKALRKTVFYELIGQLFWWRTNVEGDESAWRCNSSSFTWGDRKRCCSFLGWY